MKIYNIDRDHGPYYDSFKAYKYTNLTKPRQSGVNYITLAELLINFFHFNVSLYDMMIKSRENYIKIDINSKEIIRRFETNQFGYVVEFIDFLVHEQKVFNQTSNSFERSLLDVHQDISMNENYKKNRAIVEKFNYSDMKLLQDESVRGLYFTIAEGNDMTNMKYAKLFFKRNLLIDKFTD
jgi:hypothetical protein